MKQYEKDTYTIERNFINSEKISQHLQCSICSLVFNNPMRLDCGHTFCYKCIMNLIMNYNKLCPICRVSINEGCISRDLLAYNIINDLEVTCNNEMKGCPWKGQLVELENHLKLCDENIVYLQVKKSQSDFIGNENKQLNEGGYECIRTPSIKELLRKRVFPKTTVHGKGTHKCNGNDNDINEVCSSSIKECNNDDDDNIKRNVFKMLFEFNKDFDITNIPQLKSEQKLQIDRIFHIDKP